MQERFISYLYKGRGADSCPMIYQPTYSGRRVKQQIKSNLKLTQELATVDQYPLFLVFLDLHKAYCTVECAFLVKTL